MSESNFNFSTYKTSKMEVDDSMCALRLLQQTRVIHNIYQVLENSKRPHNDNCCSNFHGRTKVKRSSTCISALKNGQIQLWQPSKSATQTESPQHGTSFCRLAPRTRGTIGRRAEFYRTALHFSN